MSASGCGFDDLTFTIEVDFTDRTRGDDGFIIGTRQIVVMDPTDQGAALTAAQWVHQDTPEDVMVVATRIVRCVA